MQREEILTKYNFPKRILHSVAGIEEIEKEIGFDLPDDYKYYLEMYSSFEGFVGQEYLKLWDIKSMLSLNRNYEIVKELPNTIAIGSNMGGEFLGIEFIGQNKYS